jgi:hypothetical protein
LKSAVNLFNVRMVDHGDMKMIRNLVISAAIAGFVVTAAGGPASAQNQNAVGGALLGGAAGAIIGGAATGKAGGAIAGGVIGAATGAIIGSQMDAQPGGYYWYKGYCWRRNSRGDYYRVSRRRCL